MNMKIKLSHIVVLSLLFMAGCKKDELPPAVNEEPVFGAEFNFNETAHILVAGDNGLVQSANYELNDSGLVLYSGLKNPECGTCGPALSLRLESPDGYVYSSASQFPVDLEGWDIRMQDEAEEITMLQMKANTGNIFNTGLWTLNGNLLDSAITDSILFTLTEPGQYSLVFSYSEDTCSVTAEQNFFYDGNTIPCYGNVQRMIPASLEMYTVFPGPGFDLLTTTYIWNLANTVIFTGTSPFLNTVPESNYTDICVEMNDPTGCNAEVCMAALPNSAFCDATVHIVYTEIVTEVPEINDFAYLVLEYTDADGVLYTSGLENQTDATINLISLESYSEPTRPDEQFLKAVMAIDCLLYNADGVGYAFSGIVEMAFGYP